LWARADSVASCLPWARPVIAFERHGADLLGISVESVTDELLADGIASFGTSYSSLTAGLQRKRNWSSLDSR
jgi:hypothetical protein